MHATATVSARPHRIVPWSRLGDEMLAGRAASGNAAAFEALYARYHGPLLGYTRSILLDVEDARDATQNALEKALRALPSREPGRPLRPWLYKIAHNEAIAIMRRRRPQTELSPALEPTVPGPEVDAEQRGRLAQLVDDLRTLPERQRGALVMRELNGLSYDEIGSALGLSNAAARRAVFDARSALHEALDGRATACVSVRHSISDGDRRSLRARGIRAHLRSCDDCASFQRSIGARRADLHALAPWISGAAVIGVLGTGGGGGGGVLLAASGAGSTAGGGGAGWAGLSLAVKGLAVAAAVVTTGTAAVEIKHAATPDRPARKAQTARPHHTRADAFALRAAALAAGAASSSRDVPPAPAPSAGRGDRDRVRATLAPTRSHARSTTHDVHPDTPALLAPNDPRRTRVRSRPDPAAGRRPRDRARRDGPGRQDDRRQGDRQARPAARPGPAGVRRRRRDRRGRHAVRAGARDRAARPHARPAARRDRRRARDARTQAPRLRRRSRPGGRAGDADERARTGAPGTRWRAGAASAAARPALMHGRLRASFLRFRE
ncbi:MAG: hypothetical protein QOJ63_3211 [Solirubrobacteraceae bacterium]|nr:hypothetical protein [Solirubrobacteraceae bacterium]